MILGRFIVPIFLKIKAAAVVPLNIVIRNEIAVLNRKNCGGKKST